MDEFVKAVIEDYSREFAKKYGIRDKKRLRCALKRAAVDEQDVRIYDSEGNYKAGSVSFKPELDEALSYLAPEKAMSLFENSDLDQLYQRVRTSKILFHKSTPLYTRQELAGLLSRFVEYLEYNKGSMVSMGYPARSFEASPWLYFRLSRLYPTKVPDSVRRKAALGEALVSTGDIDRRDDEGNLIFDYLWLKRRKRARKTSRPKIPCAYVEAPLIDGFTKEDAERIEELRATLFNLKKKILGIAHACLRGRCQSGDFWNESLNAMVTKFAAGDFQFLGDQDRRYIALCLLRQFQDHRYISDPEPLTDYPIHLEPGGITNLLEFILNVEKEQKIGKMHWVKRKLWPLIGDRIPVSYYELASSPRIEELNHVIRSFSEYGKLEDEFAKSFDERTARDFTRRFKAPVFVPVERYQAVRTYAEFIEASQRAGVEVRGHFVTPAEKSRSIFPISLPPGANWEDITIRFLDGHNVSIKARDLNVKADYRDMGFEDKRKHLPNKQWDFLRLLAISRGEVSWKDSTASLSLKKTKQLLSKILKAYFQLPEDPFRSYKQEKAYRIRVRLVPEHISTSFR